MQPIIKNEVMVSIEQQGNDHTCYQKIGSGQDLVLVHGWGVSSEIWRSMAGNLSQRYCVHLVDLPGFGHAPDISGYSLEAIADTLLEKLPSNAIWCGWSLGGLVATYIAYHFPERVDKLIQVSTSLKFVEDSDWLGVKKEVFEAFKVGVYKNPTKTLNRFLSLQAIGSDTVKKDVITIKDLLSNQPLPSLSALIAGLDLLNTVDLREQFNQLTMPCLSLFGEHDTLVSMENSNVFFGLPLSYQQVIFSSSSHAAFISEPERFEAVLSTFIES